MRTTLTMLATAVVLLLGVAAVPLPAAADAAQRYDEADCVSFPTHDFCWTVTGLLQRNESNSGNITYTDRGRFTGTVFVGGAVVEKQSFTYHLADIVVHGDQQVSLRIDKGEYTALGQTCTFAVYFTVVNGESRHTIGITECS